MNTNFFQTSTNSAFLETTAATLARCVGSTHERSEFLRIPSECAICLSPFGDSEITITKCGHHFHANCIKQIQKDVCPNCRAPLGSSDECCVSFQGCTHRHMQCFGFGLFVFSIFAVFLYFIVMHLLISN